MTWNPGAWAIDGALLTGSLARIGERAAVKESGIVSVGDLKVRQLSSPGNGVQIDQGGAVVENRYVTDSGQMYAVENVAADILGPSTTGWPATNPGVARSHLVCVSIGDPQYSTAGHPWLTDANKPATPEAAQTFQYVRPIIIPNVPAGTVRVEDLPVPPIYPVYALARLDLPSNWTSIADAQIVDLRNVANPRSLVRQINVSTPDNDILSVATAFTYETWPDASDTSIYVPKWATKVYVTGFVNGFTQGSDLDVDAPIRVAMRKSDGTFVAACQQSVYYAQAAYLPKGTDKVVNLAGPISIPAAQRGTTCRFSTEATVANTSMNGRVATTTRTNVSITLRFVEEAV